MIFCLQLENTLILTNVLLYFVIQLGKTPRWQSVYPVYLSNRWIDPINGQYKQQPS